MRNTLLLRVLGRIPAMTQIIHFEITSEAVSGDKYHFSDLPVCLLYVRTKLAIAQLIARGYNPVLRRYSLWEDWVQD